MELNENNLEKRTKDEEGIFCLLNGLLGGLALAMPSFFIMASTGMYIMTREGYGYKEGVSQYPILESISMGAGILSAATMIAGGVYGWCLGSKKEREIEKQNEKWKTRKGNTLRV